MASNKDENLYNMNVINKHEQDTLALVVVRRQGCHKGANIKGYTSGGQELLQSNSRTFLYHIRMSQVQPSFERFSQDKFIFTYDFLWN